MPVEINELVIKAKVVDADCNDQSANDADETGSTTNQPALQQVEKTVNEALELFNRKNER